MWRSFRMVTHGSCMTKHVAAHNGQKKRYIPSKPAAPWKTPCVLHPACASLQRSPSSQSSQRMRAPDSNLALCLARPEGGTQPPLALRPFSAWTSMAAPQRSELAATVQPTPSSYNASSWAAPGAPAHRAGTPTTQPPQPVSNCHVRITHHNCRLGLARLPSCRCPRPSPFGVPRA